MRILRKISTLEILYPVTSEKMDWVWIKNSDDKDIEEVNILDADFELFISSKLAKTVESKLAKLESSMVELDKAVKVIDTKIK
jgi:hypothetical protein